MRQIHLLETRISGLSACIIVYYYGVLCGIALHEILSRITRAVIRKWLHTPAATCFKEVLDTERSRLIRRHYLRLIYYGTVSPHCKAFSDLGRGE
jgi:hypothetical protein